MPLFIELCKSAGISEQEAAAMLKLSVETTTEYTIGARVPSSREIQILKGLALGRSRKKSGTVASQLVTIRSRKSGAMPKHNEHGTTEQLPSSELFGIAPHFMSGTAIDLFCGAGGLSEGFRQAGFQVLAGNDFDQSAGETFALTHRDAVFLPGPAWLVDDHVVRSRTACYCRKHPRP
jgi:hypothetical protein